MQHVLQLCKLTKAWLRLDILFKASAIPRPCNQAAKVFLHEQLHKVTESTAHITAIYGIIYCIIYLPPRPEAL